MENHSTTTAYTPGPWHVNTSTNAAVYGGQEHFCIMPDPERTHGGILADVETLPEAAANARLMAAAPELLEACQAALQALSDPEDDYMQIAALEIALETAIQKSLGL